MAFRDKVILVTGGNSGIGKAIALHFSKENAKLVIVGRNKDTIEEVKDICTANSGNEAMGIQADVSKDTDVEMIVNKVTEKYGRLDVLVNNAGVFISDDIYTATMENFDAHINTNLRGTFNLTRSFVPLLIKAQGNVISISGVEAVKYWEGLLTDSLSKVAIQNLTKYVAYELASKKVRANSLALGYVTGTKIIQRANIDPEEFGRGFLPSVPLGEAIKPEDVAKTVAFIASDSAKHITGQNIVMDGGFSCY
ncbi:3-oxoacyl-[acyl-carrier-protein] reductase FabG-like [Leguminivora glycinivorella]|uniref:3-oxoacyl-[acyl-carrier-protein] reductase FabG-like n=1 Tax=Leguminivora glycinivorella TaxID=1035111 RepID=UPI00200DC390|nr:3-oxoacyl-[acyl-carrier-protein] reductase FabG-like [Leguminivora glycinivorella]